MRRHLVPFEAGVRRAARLLLGGLRLFKNLLYDAMVLPRLRSWLIVLGLIFLGAEKWIPGFLAALLGVAADPSGSVVGIWRFWMAVTQFVEQCWVLVLEMALVGLVMGAVVVVLLGYFTTLATRAMCILLATMTLLGAFEVLLVWMCDSAECLPRNPLMDIVERIRVTKFSGDYANVAYPQASVAIYICWHLLDYLRDSIVGRDEFRKWMARRRERAESNATNCE